MKATGADLHHRAELLAAPLPPLLVAAKRVASTVAQGVHGRRRVGQGETFWQFRRYQPGDSVPRIDWRRSAKSAHLYVRETEWEAAQSVWLWRDASASMDYASSPALAPKRRRAELLLLALSVLLVRGGERVAVLGAGTRPSSGRVVLTRIARMLEDGEPATASLPSPEALPRHARVVLIGDFLSPLAEIKATIAAFDALGVRGHLVQVLDPAEETLPFAGRVRFVGPEAEGFALIGRAETAAADYARAMAAHQAEIGLLARSAGWNFIRHRTDRPPETALLALYLGLAEPALV
jgi:uncharacterized protein (DUF58 family)